MLTPICQSTLVHIATIATSEDATIGDPPSLPYHTNQTHPLLPLCRSAPSPFLHHGSHALTSAPLTTSIHKYRSPPLPYTHCHSLPHGLPPPTIYRKRSIADITIAISTHAGTPLSLSKHGVVLSFKRHGHMGKLPCSAFFFMAWAYVLIVGCFVYIWTLMCHM